MQRPGTCDKSLRKEDDIKVIYPIYTHLQIQNILLLANDRQSVIEFLINASRLWEKKICGQGGRQLTYLSS
ncbi:hypothetical protein CRM77_09150 [Micrococcus luteus]|nr:hypothetical protein CRM77_09150 [Micrococcus luteus]